MKRDERGYIVVETVTSFLLFVLMITSILTLINVVAVQARIHYAITQAAETISEYIYVLDVAGATDHLIASAEKRDKVKGEISTFQNNVNDTLDALYNLDLEGIEESGSETLDHLSGVVEGAQDDPQGMFQDFLNFGLQGAISEAFEALLRPLMSHYLSSGDMDGNEFLLRFGVIDGIDGIKFNQNLGDYFEFDEHGFVNTYDQDSSFLNADGDVRIVAQYEIDYLFGALPLPFTKLTITQEVRTRAWLNGLGEGYTDG